MEDARRVSLAVPLVLEWYRIFKRDLPWRRERTPYSALVAELMLQQTRVEAVKEKYVAFMRRFPTAEALAAASEDEVFKSWEGLGYYSRARNLHKAAKIIAQEGFPRTWVGVRALPGVGDYTAGAISSIALGLKEPAVDGNVLRILTRLLADGSNIDESGTKARFKALLAEVYPDETADFCEALMELGALVCVPNRPPMCGACPWSDLCKAHIEGRETEFPVRFPKRERKQVEASVLVLRCGNKYALEKREKGLLKGLYGFPFFEGEIAPAAYGTVLESKRAVHIFTHVEWDMTGYLVDTASEGWGYLWKTAEEIASACALPSAFCAFKAWLF